MSAFLRIPAADGTNVLNRRHFRNPMGGKNVVNVEKDIIVAELKMKTSPGVRFVFSISALPLDVIVKIQ